jgi:hypothetical protein
MDVNKVIGELREYRSQIEEAIAALEGLARRAGKRRGRPPKWLSGVSGPKRVVSEETRQKMAAAQKKRWAAYRKNKQAKPAAG